MKPALIDLLREQFPSSTIPENTANLAIGSFAEWDSMAHFNFLMLVEESYDVRFSVEQMAELKSLVEIEQALSEMKAL
jgi:acyl carrier protein